MRRLVSWIAVAVALVLCGPALAGAQDGELEQTIDSRQRVAEGEKTLARGHVDVGPRYVGGRWTLMVHDDAAKAGGGESVWRRPERTVLRVSDAALQRVPDDPAYGFLHAKPGAEVHVVPQTQDPDVVWLGWNTQDPEVMETIDRGVTLSLEGVQGPGDLVVFLQSGDFAEPKVLWDSTREAKPIFVDVNTHSHANWVFTRPGVYLARVKVSAELVDGSTVSDTRELRFAVGAGADAKQALAARWSGPAVAAVPPSAAEGQDAPATGGGGGASVVLVAILALALALAAVGGVLTRRGREAKRLARERA